MCALVLRRLRRWRQMDRRKREGTFFNKRSEAASKLWAEPGYREHIMKLRASHKPPPVPPAKPKRTFTLGEKGWVRDGDGTAAEGIPLMKRDQNLWMEKRLAKAEEGRFYVSRVCGKI